jgi:eukaryotic-like serine/threonine-protein kinase
VTTPPTDGGRFADDGHRYALTSRIATGGMGEVWRGTDTLLSRPVAVKVLKPEYADDALFRTRFETEARHAASLHHPGIASVFDFGEATAGDGSTSPRPFLVMELVEGQPLSALLRPGTPMEPDVVRDLLAQAATALGAAHAAGIVHRDVKPGNLIVTPDRRTKVTDFGIARAAEGMALTETGQVMGTPAYISPEQAEGGRASAASDVYSLGIVAFECLAGRKPFAGDTPVAIALAHLRQPVPDLPAEVPADLAAVVRRSMAKDPAERYADGAAFAAALRDPSVGASDGTATVVAPLAARDEPTPTQVLSPVPAAGAAGGVAASSGAAAPAPAPRDDDRRRGGLPGWLPWLLLGVALLVGAFVLVQALAGDDTTGDQTPPPQAPSKTPSQTTSRSPSPTPSPTETSTQTPTETPTQASVEVDEASYLGRDIKDVESELRDLGLQVRKERVDNPGGETEDAVSGVDPSGTLQEGDTVTVSYWGKAPKETPTETPTSPVPAPSTTGSPTGSPT